MVIWITGISGAGKTTLAQSLTRILKPRLPELVLVDGDTIRDLFGTGLGFSEPERIVQIRRLQSLAKMLDEQGIVCVVAALYAHPDLLAWNRENFRDYLEVYIEAPLSLVQQRDAKGLYAAARAGKMANMVGIDIPWHAPQAADVVIDAATGEPPERLARRVVQAHPRLARVIAAEVVHE